MSLTGAARAAGALEDAASSASRAAAPVSQNVCSPRPSARGPGLAIALVVGAVVSAGGAERAKRRRRLLPVSSGGARGLALAALAFVALFAPSAQAFAPEARPWQPTPERFLRTAADHPQAVRLPSLEAAGLSPWSYRLDGRPAFAFAARGALAIGPLALELAAAEALALELARASAPALGISASDLVLDG